MDELMRFSQTAKSLEHDLKEASKQGPIDSQTVLKSICEQSKVIHELGITIQERHPEGFPTIKGIERFLLKEAAEVIFKLQTDLMAGLTKSKERDSKEIVASIEDMILYIDSYVLPYLLRVEVTERFYEILRYSINEIANQYFENNGRESGRWEETSERIKGLVAYAKLIGLETPTWFGDQITV